MLTELISKFEPGEFIALAAVVLGISAGIIALVTAIISVAIGRYRERQLTADLIHSLADRGMSAEEIERLVRASAIGKLNDLRQLIAQRLAGQRL